MKIDIMGTTWEICERSAAEDVLLSDCDGYTDWTIRRIVVEKEREGSLENMDFYIRKVLRHEIVHAFLFECGLHESSASGQAWARNEEMVDWFARIGPRIYKAWRDANAVD